MKEIVITEVTVIRFAGRGEAIIVNPDADYHPADHYIDETSTRDEVIKFDKPEWHPAHTEDLVNAYDCSHVSHNGW